MLLVFVVQIILQIMRAFATALSCLPALEGKSLLLKKPHTSDTGHGILERNLTLKALFLQSAFTVSGSIM